MKKTYIIPSTERHAVSVSTLVCAVSLQDPKANLDLNKSVNADELDARSRDVAAGEPVAGADEEPAWGQLW